MKPQLAIVCIIICVIFKVDTAIIYSAVNHPNPDCLGVAFSSISVFSWTPCTLWNEIWLTYACNTSGVFNYDYSDSQCTKLVGSGLIQAIGCQQPTYQIYVCGDPTTTGIASPISYSTNCNGNISTGYATGTCYSIKISAGYAINYCTGGNLVMDTYFDLACTQKTGTGVPFNSGCTTICTLPGSSTTSSSTTLAGGCGGLFVLLFALVLSKM